MRCEHTAQPAICSEDRRSVSSVWLSGNLPSTIVAAPTNANVLTRWRRWRRSPSCCSHHLPANLPNAGIVRGGEHGSFSRGHEASSSMKGCSLGMHLWCVAPIRPSAREMCSTLPARRVDLSRFTLAPKRMYLLCFNARYASDIGPCRVPSDNVCAGTHLFGTVVR